MAMLPRSASKPTSKRQATDRRTAVCQVHEEQPVDENRTRASRPQAADFDAVKQEPRNGIPNQSAQSAPPLSLTSATKRRKLARVYSARRGLTAEDAAAGELQQRAAARQLLRRQGQTPAEAQLRARIAGTASWRPWNQQRHHQVQIEEAEPGTARKARRGGAAPAAKHLRTCVMSPPAAPARRGCETVQTRSSPARARVSSAWLCQPGGGPEGVCGRLCWADPPGSAHWAHSQ
eukprot:CAMPEP_0177277368 /NCGR_PEP_ID=MMETSP0367-20130122/68755_1 /TAXON_ID=447022 ORGANISM="Scrippsiella hangoei-like, Strain SHHI-4" /NCGR_SAMPLE_ID=MMETSP0367 /ASSEMBLY_ACC=CAM_ASM_000362 /LENGTH=233 /DNA_ID=CAMNT_0018733949 /DNA_START=304 /DNA_END=1003 /DNA_ORIENTATION=-